MALCRLLRLICKWDRTWREGYAPSGKEELSIACRLIFDFWHEWERVQVFAKWQTKLPVTRPYKLLLMREMKDKQAGYITATSEKIVVSINPKNCPALKFALPTICV